MDIKPTKITGIKRTVKFTEKNFNNLDNYIDLVNEHKKNRELNLTIAAIINPLLEDFFKQDTTNYNIKSVKIEYGVSRNFHLTEENFNNLKEYTQKFNLTYADVINPLVEDFFKDLVFNNTYIELDKPLYFNKRELFENGIAKTTKLVLEHPLEETIVIERISNNLDVLNFDNELTCYCYGDNSSIHAGIYIIPNLDDGEDYYLNLLYDSDKEITTIRIINNIDDYFDNTDDKQRLIKEKLLSDVEEIKNKYNSDNELTDGDLELYCIMYDYIKRKNILEDFFNKFEPNNVYTISTKYKEEFKEKMFNNTLKGVLFKDFKPI